MKVKVIKEFLGIPLDSIGIVTTKEGEPRESLPTDRAMWMKFECKDMSVGIPEPFDYYVQKIKEDI